MSYGKERNIKDHCKIIYIKIYGNDRNEFKLISKNINIETFGKIKHIYINNKYKNIENLLW